MLKLNDGRAELYQWDTGRTATVAVACDEVHFSHMKIGESVNVKVIDGQVKIPNGLLRLGLDVYCWAFVRTKSGGYTCVKKRFDVKKRPKPADYITTPDEQATWTDLENRIEKLEKEGVPSGGGTTDAPVTSVNGKIGDIVLTAEDVGAASAKDVGDIETALDSILAMQAALIGGAAE